MDHRETIQYGNTGKAPKEIRQLKYDYKTWNTVINNERFRTTA